MQILCKIKKKKSQWIHAYWGTDEENDIYLRKLLKIHRLKHLTKCNLHFMQFSYVQYTHFHFTVSSHHHTNFCTLILFFSHAKKFFSSSSFPSSSLKNSLLKSIKVDMILSRGRIENVMHTHLSSSHSPIECRKKLYTQHQYTHTHKMQFNYR